MSCSFSLWSFYDHTKKCLVSRLAGERFFTIHRGPFIFYEVGGLVGFAGRGGGVVARNILVHVELT